MKPKLIEQSTSNACKIKMTHNSNTAIFFQLFSTPLMPPYPLLGLPGLVTNSKTVKSPCFLIFANPNRGVHNHRGHRLQEAFVPELPQPR